MITLQYGASLTLADRWILARLRRLITQVTAYLEEYEYAIARSEIEAFFWQDLADNYLEMCKQRLYGNLQEPREAAIAVLDHCLLCTIKLLAPFLPFVTEAIYQELFAKRENAVDGSQRKAPAVNSIHKSQWPAAEVLPEDSQTEKLGALLIDIASAVRRYKSERNMPLGNELYQVKLASVADDTVDDELSAVITCLADAVPDLQSVTRARTIVITDRLPPGVETIRIGDQVLIQIIDQVSLGS
jgi:valyl-tRNA synthetase